MKSKLSEPMVCMISDSTALLLPCTYSPGFPGQSIKHFPGCSHAGYSYQLCHMKICICSINLNSLFKAYYTKQETISEVEMDFQNNIKMKMFSGLWFLNLWVKLNHFHSAVDIPYRRIHKYQALQNIMPESKGRSYPAVRIKAVITVHKKLSACCFKVIFFWCTDFRREGNSVFQDVITWTCSKVRNTTNRRIGWSWEFADGKNYYFHTLNPNHCQTKA